MKKGFKKFFTKKDKSPQKEEAKEQEEAYVKVEGSTLTTLSNTELIDIIYKYDSELRYLNTQMETLKESQGKLTKCQEEMQLYRQHFEGMQEVVSEKNQEISRLKNEIDIKNQQNTEHIASLEKEFEEQKKETESEYLKKIQSLESLLQQKRSSEETGQSSEINQLEAQVKNLFEEKSVLAKENHELSEKIKVFEQENAKLSQNLDRALKKREVAKNEVLKLNKKLETLSQEPKSSPDKFGELFKLDNSDPSPAEQNSMYLLKKELEFLYKDLMNMIMNGSTTSAGDSLAYTISSEDFSNFERRLNNALVQVKEALDSPAEVATENSWSSKFSSAVARVKDNMSEKGPVKIFSCIGSQEEPRQRPRTNQGRRLISNTGGNRPRMGRNV